MNDKPLKNGAVAEPEKSSLIEYPAKLSVKAMGLQSLDFQTLIENLVGAAIAPQTPTKVSAHESSKGKYVSVRVYFTAHSEDELKRVYQALHDEARVLFTL